MTCLGVTQMWSYDPNWSCHFFVVEAMIQMVHKVGQNWLEGLPHNIMHFSTYQSLTCNCSRNRWRRSTAWSTMITTHADVSTWLASIKCSIHSCKGFSVTTWLWEMLASHCSSALFNAHPYYIILQFFHFYLPPLLDNMSVYLNPSCVSCFTVQLMKVHGPKRPE